MAGSSGNGAASNSDARPRQPIPRRGWIARGVLLVVFAGVGGRWYNERRTISWNDALSPSYWVRRYKGEDLYDPSRAILMHGNRTLPEVALTFDDGPHRPSRPEILAILKRYNVKATFFDVGLNMTRSPDLVRRTLAEGNEEGNHSYNHLRLTPLKPRRRHEEINDVDITYFRITGKHLFYLRPPGMNFNSGVLALTRKMGYVVVDYTTASADFVKDANPDDIYSRTVRRTESGSIILLHDYPGTAVALPRIIETLRDDGYRFVTISEMIDHLPKKQRVAAESFLATAQCPPRLATAIAVNRGPHTPIVH